MPHSIYSKVQCKLECFLEASIVTCFQRYLAQDEENSQVMAELVEFNTKWSPPNVSKAPQGLLMTSIILRYSVFLSQWQPLVYQKLHHRCSEADPPRACFRRWRSGWSPSHGDALVLPLSVWSIFDGTYWANCSSLCSARYSCLSALADSKR